MRDQRKTGHAGCVSKTKLFYPAASCGGKSVLVRQPYVLCECRRVWRRPVLPVRHGSRDTGHDSLAGSPPVRWLERDGSCRCPVGRETVRLRARRDESAGGQIEDQATIHLLIEVEVELVEGLLGVSKLGLFVPAFE
jgi:hypothetical protein